MQPLFWLCFLITICQAREIVMYQVLGAIIKQTQVNGIFIPKIIPIFQYWVSVYVSVWVSPKLFGLGLGFAKTEKVVSFVHYLELRFFWVIFKHCVKLLKMCTYTTQEQSSRIVVLHVLKSVKSAISSPRHSSFFRLS